MTKKNLISIIAKLLIGGTVLLFLIIGAIYVGKLVVKDIQLSRAERVIEKAKEEYAHCIVIMEESHETANEAREKIAELNGTGDFTEGIPSLPQSPTTLTGPQTINNQ